ncbi:sulfite exporter TauE/SafE family protein [Aquabacter cavernae]|uniref:sulfite exporter TauE/SafE family protein n=1 Tax=Aquabacter cavernae TaxID=2496029 RepID=UPI000F8D4CDA|nr:sulfite exporter TauE/SafE family protein [Aquabacter cavernae]
MTLTFILAIIVIFVLAGAVKGATGMGLPTLGMGLLSLLMAPADAAALLIVPAILTNVIQFATGPRRGAVLRRFWLLGVFTILGTLAGAWTLGGLDSHFAPALLGATLLVYGLFGLAKLQFHTPARLERWLSPVMGLASGILTGTTGVTVMPVAPYLQSLDLDREDLVQALGLDFTLSTFALAVTLSMDFTALSDARVALASAGALVPAFIGMELGKRLRLAVSQATFRAGFFAALALLGANTLVRALPL